MAKKKKNKKTKNRHKNIKLHSQSIDALVENAQSALASGKARDAVESLKIALKKQGRPEAIHPLLFRAYLSRAKELRGKGMTTEANMLIEQAMARKPANREMQEADLADYVFISPTDQAFAAYAEYLEGHSPSVKVECQLVNRLIRSEDWHLLDQLDPSVPLCKEAQPVPAAVEQMKQGHWEAGLEALRSIPRSSPYAPLRMLCRAMTAFYNNDDAGLEKIAAMLPDDFILSPAIKQLSGILNDPANTPNEPLAAVKLLFDGPLGAGEKIRELVECVKKRRRNRVIRKIKELVQTIYPEDPDSCMEAILECLGRTAFIDGSSSQEFYFDLIDAMLPREKVFQLILRIDMFIDMPLNAAAAYIRRYLPSQFPEPQQQAVAKSQVLLHALKKSLENETLPYEWEEAYWPTAMQPERTDWQALGVRSGNPETARLEIAREGIDCDPENREWYELLAQLPRYANETKKIVENALNEMAGRFPDDPFPFLELAALYQQKSAYRKAEKAIEEAARRAPYDNRVIDKKAISYLISAEKNLGRGKYHLVHTDLEKAKALNSRRAGLFIRAKKTALTLLENQSASEALMDQMLADLASLERVRGLCILALEFAGRKTKKSANTLAENLADMASARLAREIKAVKEVNAAGIYQLLDPVPPEFQPAITFYPPHAMAAILPELEVLRLLAGVDETEIIPICDRLLDMGWYGTAYEELARRINEHGAATRPLIDFYQTVLADLSGKTTDVKHLLFIIETADEATDNKLETAASKLAPHARGKLQRALYLYDFEIFLETYAFYEIDDDEFGDEDLTDEKWDHDNIFEEEDQSFADDADAYYQGMTPEQVVADLEGIIDRMHFRGSPDYILRTMRPVIFNSRPETRFVKEILQSFPPDMFENISREVSVLFLES